MTVRLNQIRCERQCAIKARQCVLLLPDRRQRPTQQHMRTRVPWVARERLAHERRTFGKPALLTGDGPKIVGSIGIVRIGALQFGVNRGRFGYGAAPMQRQSFLQQIGCRGGEHGSRR